MLVPAVLGLGQIRSTSATYDEPVHLAAGYTDLVDGRFRLNALDHPPLAEMWAALPLLALRPNVFPTHPAWLNAAVYHYGDLFLNQNRVSGRKLLGTARVWNLLTLTVLLAAALVLWARRLEGDEGALGAAIAFAFCVPWIANASLVTTDAMSAALFFVAFSLMSVRPRPRRVWLAAGAVTGAALASKFNMVVLPALMTCCLLGEAKVERRAVDWKSFGGAVFSSIALLTLCYGVYHLALFYDGLQATFSRLSQGRPSYLMGRWSSQGWWYYFPVAVLVKTPLPLLLLGAGGAVLAARRKAAEAVWLLLPPIGYFLASLTTKTQIGYRHILPVYPFLCLWAGLALARLWRTAGRVAAVVLAAWLAVTVARVHPHHLAYFNEAAGGPADGAKWLADSNLDWGQDLKGLSEAVAARGNPPVVLSYFGSDDPAAYGLSYAPVGMIGNVERAGAPDGVLRPGAPVLFAVSQTNASAVYFERKDAFAWLESRAPVARPGWSIALYDLTADADGRARVAAMLEGAGRPGDAKVLRLHSTP